MNETIIAKINDTLTVELTDEDVDDIMAAALEGGVTADWAMRVNVISSEDWTGYASEQLTKGNKLSFKLEDGTETDPVGLEDFLAGFCLWYAEDPQRMSPDYALDIGEIDAVEADCILQYALFGDLIYG